MEPRIRDISASTREQGAPAMMPVDLPDRFSAQGHVQMHTAVQQVEGQGCLSSWEAVERGRLSHRVQELSQESKPTC